MGYFQLDLDNACSFCGVGSPTRRVIATTDERRTWICDVCIGHCAEILGEALAERDPSTTGKPLDISDPGFLDALSDIVERLRGGVIRPGYMVLVNPSPPAARTDGPPARADVHCSFCAKPETEVARLISGQMVFICEGCVVAAAHVLDRFGLRQNHGNLFDELVALLFRHDPIGLDFETNTDEYEPEARALLPRLGSCKTVDDVARELHEVFVQLFDTKIAGPRSVYDRIAPDVFRLSDGLREPKR